MRSTYLVCYDIGEDKRREKVFKICKNHGVRLQFSVFECDLNSSERIALERELHDAISQDADQILFVSLGPAESRGDRVIAALGKPYSKFDAPCYVA